MSASCTQKTGLSVLVTVIWLHLLPLMSLPINMYIVGAIERGREKIEICESIEDEKGFHQSEETL